MRHPLRRGAVRLSVGSLVAVTASSPLQEFLRLRRKRKPPRPLSAPSALTRIQRPMPNGPRAEYRGFQGNPQVPLQMA